MMTGRTVLAFCLAFAPAATPSLYADAFITACGSDTGAGVNLKQALPAGGSIYFQCAPGSVIRMSGVYAVPPGTLLDGSGNVTLDGAGLQGPLLSSPAGKITLRRINVRNMKQRPVTISRTPEPGAVAAIGRVKVSVVDAPEVELDHASIDTSESPISAGEKLTVRDSTFTGNTGLVLSTGTAATALIQRANFIGNESSISIRQGTVTNSAFTNGTKGAVSIAFPTGRVEIRNCSFQGNKGGSAIRLSQRSSRPGVAMVSLRGNKFVDNKGSPDAGGAITILDTVATAPPSVRPSLSQFPPCRFEFSYDRFRSNEGALAGAIAVDLNNTAGLKITGGIFVDNLAALNGGAIAFAGGGPLVIGHSLFKANRAVGQGAAIYGAKSPAGSITIANSLIVENKAADLVRPLLICGAVNADTAAMANVTIANNDTEGIVLRGSERRVPFLSNMILSSNRGGNCSGIPAGAFHGGNMQFGSSDCPGVSIADPYLDSFYIPALGSPALSLGDPAICSSAPVSGRDIVFEQRINPTACALGAFEHAPLRKIPKPEVRQ